MTKVLKIKVGSVYIKDLDKSFDVFSEAWEKTKDGNTYYEIKNPVFVNQVEIQNKVPAKITA